MGEGKHWFRRRAVFWGGAVLLLLGLISGGIWWRTRPDGRLHIIVPAIKGDALLIITPHGNTMMIDGSADSVGITSFIGARLPFWQRSLDVLGLTRADEQHLPGVLALARRYTVGRTLLAPLADDGQGGALRAALSEEATSAQIAVAGDTLTLDGVQITVLQAATRDGGVTFGLQYKSFSAILAAQPDDAQATQLIQSGPRSTLLWWPWARPDDRQMAERAQASVVVYGESPSGRPEPRSMFERGDTARRLLHEDLHGTIEIATDGAQLWITTEKGD
jgi:competence protein ComEC